jgi:UDP-2-acetamido-2-deoxy-ribo-hexuluronate aminotransferase
MNQDPQPVIASEARQSMSPVVLPHIEPHNTSVYAQYTIRIQSREALQQKLKAAGIPTTVHYPLPLNQQPAVADAAAQLPVGDAVARQVLSLPMHPYLSPADQRTVVAALQQA